MTVGIVGAGISGLALAHYLDSHGTDAVVFEARDEPGGVVRSRTVDGRVLDLGPQRTRLTPAIRDVVTELDLTSELRRGADGPLYVYHDGDLRRAPTDPRSAVTTDLLSVTGKLRVLAEPLTAPPRDDETVGAYLRRAFGPEVAERFVGPLYAGLYGSHPDEMPVRHSFGKAVERLGSPRSLLLAAVRHVLADREVPPVVSFEDGLGALPAALAAHHADRIQFDTPVRTIARRGEHGDDGYLLRTDDGETAVDSVVLTTPAATAANLLEPVASEAANALAALSYNPLAAVHVVADGGVDASGFQVAFDEPLALRGVTSNHGLFGRDGLHTCYLGGRDAAELLEASDERLGERAAAEFGVVTGRDARPLHVHRIQPGMPAYDRSWRALDGLDLPDGIHLCANYAARAGIPGRFAEAKRLAADLTE